MNSKLPVTRGGKVVAYALVDPDIYARVHHRIWRVSTTGYAYACFDGGNVVLHRLVLGLVTGDGRHTDHINRDRLDNRRTNLRIATPATNAQNREIRTAKSSRFRGVSWHPAGAWEASVMLDGVPYKLGRYLSEEIAGLIAETKRKALHPYAEPDSGLVSAGLIPLVGQPLECGECGASSEMRNARYWVINDLLPTCQECNGYLPPIKRRPRKPPRACTNCGRHTTHPKLGRCEACYAYFRRTGRENAGTLFRKTDLL